MGAQTLTDKYGRRFTFLKAAIGFIIGTLVMVTSANLTSLLIGRTVVGFGVGIGLAVDPIYILLRLRRRVTVENL